MKENLKLRIRGLRGAVEYLTRGSGKSAKLQAQGYLKALEDVEQIIEHESSLITEKKPKTLFEREMEKPSFRDKYENHTRQLTAVNSFGNGPGKEND